MATGLEKYEHRQENIIEERFVKTPLFLKIMYTTIYCIDDNKYCLIYHVLDMGLFDFTLQLPFNNELVSYKELKKIAREVLCFDLPNRDKLHKTNCFYTLPHPYSMDCKNIKTYSVGNCEKYAKKYNLRNCPDFTFEDGGQVMDDYFKLFGARNWQEFLKATGRK